MLENNKVNDETKEKLAFLGNMSNYGRRESEPRNVPLEVINELETTGKNIFYPLSFISNFSVKCLTLYI
jgi:hypothetical protein